MFHTFSANRRRNRRNALAKRVIPTLDRSDNNAGDDLVAMRSAAFGVGRLHRARAPGWHCAEDVAMTIELTLNGRRGVSFGGDPQIPLLWYLREHAKLTGTKFGCGIGYCGSAKATL
jgi:hypothetical protein